MKSFPQFWFIFRKISLLQNDSVKPVNEKERTKVNRRNNPLYIFVNGR